MYVRYVFLLSDQWPTDIYRHNYEFLNTNYSSSSAANGDNQASDDHGVSYAGHMYIVVW